MKYKIFVDGQEGTTGLKIHDYLSKRTDIEVLKIDIDKRKDLEARKALLNEADIAFLCLPDVASREAVSLIDNDRTRVIDASTAFRTDLTWAYGFPELNKNQREKIKSSKRVSVPGCHATGFISMINPLIEMGILPKDYPTTCTSVTGYSGGGKGLIEKYEKPEFYNENLKSPKHYGLKLNHKHLPEMQKVTGLEFTPVFTPIVGSFYKGMGVTVPLVTRFLNKKLTAEELRDKLAEYYQGEEFIKVMPFDSDADLDNGFSNIELCNNTNRIDIFVFGNNEQILLLARFDNLGKGASGAAIQNMNIMLGVDEETGLNK